jgi:diacylglycerol kinase family enzyme
MVCCKLKLHLKIQSSICTIGIEATVTKNTTSAFFTSAKVTALKFPFAVYMRKVNSCARQNAISEEGSPEKQSVNEHNSDSLFRWIS